MKNPLTPTWIEPATFRIVAQHLNHCATAVPADLKMWLQSNMEWIWSSALTGTLVQWEEKSILSPETTFQTGHSLSPRANVKKERTLTSIPPIRFAAETPFFNIITNIEIDTERCRYVSKADVGNEPSTSAAT